MNSLNIFRRSALTFLLIIVTVYPVISQVHLSGVVAEENDKGEVVPLYGVNVFWMGTTIGTTTDEHGVFKILDDHSNHKLVISYVGYENDTIIIENHEDLMVVLKNAKVMDKVEIVYRKKATSLSFMDPRHTEVLNEKELFKAACCNLSESFETNASVDASFSDAVSGTRQIQMLGLAGIYSQITNEQLPTNRGLATVYGLTYTPGAWLDNISISKGTGSVVQGYESITGQINTELRKPDGEEKFYFNAYGNQGGRLEANVDYKIRLNEKWTTSLLLHGKTLQQKNDVNNDGFLDMPLNETFVGMNRWKYEGVGGLRSQFGVKYVNISGKGGQVDHVFEGPKTDQLTWGTEHTDSRIEGFGKLGYVFPDKKYQSIGLQLFAVDHQHESYYGTRIYNGDEQSAYLNLIYQNIIGTSDHQYAVGLSYLYDDFEENLDSLVFARTEMVPGAFLEYTFTRGEHFTLVAGARVDQHNMFGTFFTPRLHIRYAAAEKTVFRVSGGMGTRVANVLAENSSYLASSRDFIFPGTDKAFGMNPERAVNFGLSFTQGFRLDYRDGEIIVDLYRSEFLEQTVVDLDQSTKEVNFYNLGDGRSFANSFQVQLNYELIRRLDMKLAYRFYDVRTDFTPGLLLKALLPRQKGFANLAYETRKNKNFGLWKFDVTYQLVGEQRLPQTLDNPDEYQLDEYAPSYGLLSAQITRVFNKQFELYLGGENLTDFRQENPIVSADDPFGQYFDASMVWAPIFGRMLYAGLRWKIK